MREVFSKRLHQSNESKEKKINNLQLWNRKLIGYFHTIFRKMFLFDCNKIANMKSLIVCAILGIIVGSIRAESNGLQKYLQEVKVNY